MKRIFMLTLLLLMSFGCLACGQSNENTKAAEVSKTEVKTSEAKTETSSTASTLVVYFSQTGTTAKIGDTIAETLHADKYVVKAQKPYTQDDLNYNDSSTRATVEQRDDNARPEIQGELPDLSKYDTIYIGYPIWWGQAPKIMYTFVESCDLSGKKVIPFCVSAQSGIGDSARILAEVSKGKADWHEGRRFSSSASKEDIKTWLDRQ